MDRAELTELLTPEALRLLDSLPPYESQHDVVATVAALRGQGHPPARVSTVLTQSRLRRRARAKFGDFAERMLFTEAGLEQATRLSVAAQHAGRYARAGISSVADLGCGLGADAMALAAVDLEVRGVEADEVTAALASFNLAPFEHAAVAHARAESTDLSGMDAAYLDPARRTAGHADTRRRTDPHDYTPSLEFALSVAETLPTGIKLGPGFDRALIPAEAEAQWVSVDGQAVELGLWFGALARTGIHRAALVMRDGQTHELTAGDDSDDAAPGPLGEYVYEPDAAVIRSRLIGDLARRVGARMLDPHIAYMTADAYEPTPFARGFRVLDELPVGIKPLRVALAERGIGTLEIKKRGVDADPARLRTQLRLEGRRSGTLLLTRRGQEHIALLVERMD